MCTCMKESDHDIMGHGKWGRCHSKLGWDMVGGEWPGEGGQDRRGK